MIIQSRSENHYFLKTLKGGMTLKLVNEKLIEKLEEMISSCKENREEDREIANNLRKAIEILKNAI